VSDRKSPPFIPKKHRDGAEVAHFAKGGAPSRTEDGRVTHEEPKSTEKRNPRPRHRLRVWGTRLGMTDLGARRRAELEEAGADAVGEMGQVDQG
jgi:hypothetical protein